MYLWVEACNIVVYILNCCPHTTTKDKAPKEAFTGDKPQVSHFCVLVALFTLMFLVRRGLNLNPQALRIFLLVTMRLPRLTGFTFLHKGRHW
jgi:hypothetical protein